MAYTLGNKYAKNLCKWVVLLQLIIENVVTCFLEHVYIAARLAFMRGVLRHGSRSRNNIYYIYRAYVSPRSID